MQRSSSMSVPKQWTNQKIPEAGQVLQAFVYSRKLAWQLYYLTVTWWRRYCYFRYCITSEKRISRPSHSVLRFFFSECRKSVFRHKGTFCVNGPLLHFLHCTNRLCIFLYNKSSFLSYFNANTFRHFKV